MEATNKHNVPIELLARFLAGECDEQEQEQVDLWRKLSEANQKEFDAFSKLWRLTDKPSEHETIDLDKEWKRMKKVISPNHGKVIVFKRIVQLAAVVVISIGLSLLVFKQTQNIAIQSGTERLTDVILPDGSVVSLNAHSKIIYQKKFNASNRNIALWGEAFFEVVPNKSLPFVISAAKTRIEVVGTRFNVRAYKRLKEVKVTVVEGTVNLYEVKTPEHREVLKAGESATLLKNKNEVFRKETHQPNDIAWKTRVLTFENTPLNEVIDVLQNTYQTEFDLEESIRGCKVTVEFRDKDLGSVLQVLKSTLDLKMVQTKQKILITGPGC